MSICATTAQRRSAHPGNVGRLPDEDFCADLDAVVEVDHVGVIETKASR